MTIHTVMLSSSGRRPWDGHLINSGRCPIPVGELQIPASTMQANGRAVAPIHRRAAVPEVPSGSSCVGQNNLVE